MLEGKRTGAGGRGRGAERVTPAPEAVVLAPQGCYEKVKMWFDDNKHVLGTVGMCILIVQVRGPSSLVQLSPKARGREDRRGPCPSPPGLRPRGLCEPAGSPHGFACDMPVPTARGRLPCD